MLKAAEGLIPVPTHSGQLVGKPWTWHNLEFPIPPVWKKVFFGESSYVKRSS